jgi:hypothetical protein
MAAHRKAEHPVSGVLPVVCSGIRLAMDRRLKSRSDSMRIRLVLRFLAPVVVPFIVCPLSLSTGPDDCRLAKLIHDLDDPRYRVREGATRALEKMGDLPCPALRKSLQKGVSLETRVRIERILKKRLKFHADRAKADARSWALASHLLQAFQMIERDHIVPTSQQQLAVWSVHGMYEEAGEGIPPEITRRLERLRKANRQAIRTLLHDARFRLGLRRELHDGRDLEICLRAVFKQLEPGVKAKDRSYYIRPEELEPLRLGG